MEDVSKYVELFSALYASGKWTIQELKQLAGLNFLRVWREVEKVGILGIQVSAKSHSIFEISVSSKTEKMQQFQDF